VAGAIPSPAGSSRVEPKGPFMTKFSYRGLLALLLLTGFLAAPARAVDEKSTQPYVVIVGINNYHDQQILPRKHAEADARSLYDVFTSKDHLGVDAGHVKLLLGSDDAKRHSQSATRANILKALSWVAENARRDDPVIVALFMQAAPLGLGDRSAYFASDSTFKNRAKDAVDSGDIQTALDKLKSQRFVAFLDVNYMGFTVEKNAPDPSGKLPREFMGKEDEKAGTYDSRVLFLANSGLKPSLELKNHGVFAKVLVDGLKGKADRDGYEPDGLITVSELAKYVREEVPAQVRLTAKNEDEQLQLPFVFSHQIGDFVIAQNPTITARVAKQVAAFDRIAQSHKLAKSLVEEGHNLLSRMPKLEARQSLRKAYQKLAAGTLAMADFQKERENILESTRLREVEAASYARMVLRATEVVREGYVKSVNQGQLVDWAVNGLYKYLEEKLPSKIKERLDNAKGLTKADLLRLLAEARQHLGKREDLAEGKDITLSLHPMLGKLDRHTDYIDPETLKREESAIQGHFSGIGVQIRKNNAKDVLQVVTPIIGSPAYKAKMYAGDLITTIIREVDSNGKALEKPEVIPTKGLSTEDAVKKILGQPGTRIKLIVERDGHEKPLEFNLIRGRVEVETVLGAKRNEDDSWNYVIDPDNKICYVRLTQFTRNTQRDLDKVMRKLSKAGVKGFILDLRFNPGGLLDSAVKISDMFIDDGMIVTIRPRNGPETSYVGRSDGSYTAFPMVCLVNGYSASASEIVSACLQDHGRAIIMGSRTYGKGSVQTILPFETGGQLKLTTATYWRPNGKNINKASTQGRPEDEWGVTPDKGFKLELSNKELGNLQDHQREAEIIQRPDRRNGSLADHKTEFHDRQLDMALRYLRQQIRTAYGEGPPAKTTKKGG
jgi:C-terminal peptidase prc